MTGQKKMSVEIKIGWPWTIVAILTGMIGANVNQHLGDSRWWGVVDAIFWVPAWIKWLVLQQVNLSIIRETFEFLLK